MEQLIYELNSQANQAAPERIRDIQRKIQLLQRQHSSWQLGLDFLRRENDILRFYGALTLTIKINVDWDNDGFEDDPSFAARLLEDLVSCYVRLTDGGDASFVLLKLCSTLSAYFIKASPPWEWPIRHLFASFLNGQYVPEDQVGDSNALISALRPITYRQLRGLIEFCTTLAEDATRSDSTSVKGASVGERLVENSGDVWILAVVCLMQLPGLRASAGQHLHVLQLNIANSELVDIVTLVLELIPLWAHFSQPSQSISEDDSKNVNPFTLQRCLLLVFACFGYSDLADSTILVLTTLTQSIPRTMKSIGPDVIRGVIRSDHTQNLVEALLEGEFSSEGLHYVEYLDSLIDQENLSSPDYLRVEYFPEIIQTLQKLMHCEGTAIVEDEVCQMVLESLSKVVEGYSDWVGEDESDDSMKDMILEVCGSCMVKSRFPLEEMNASTRSWDADDRARFQDFRNDVQDFLQSAFSSIANNLVSVLAQTLLSKDDDGDWPGFEAGLFCLGTFSESSMNETESYNAAVASIFGMKTWKSVVYNTSSIPDRARQGTIKFVAQNTSYLQRQPQELVPCLNFLFSSLQLQGSTNAASKAIYTLCFAQRSILVEALPQFLASLDGVLTIGANDKHRIFSSVASIVQALPTERGKAIPLTELITRLSNELDAIETSGNTVSEEALAAFVDILQTLAAIGKGLRAPTDAVIDLDAPAHAEADFWTLGPGKAVQNLALSICLRALSSPGQETNGDLVEAACDFFNSGYTEEDPSPFKFSPDVSIDFLTSQTLLSNPNIEAVMSCASAFLSSNKPEHLQQNFPILLNPVVNNYQTLVSEFHKSQDAPDSSFTSSTLNFLTRLLPKWGTTWLSQSDSSYAQQTLAIVLELALIVLSDPDTVPRRSAASFLTALFDFPAPLPATTAAAMNLSHVLSSYTPRLLATLIHLLGGECARSELDSLSEPLRKLIQKHPRLLHIPHPNLSSTSPPSPASSTTTTTTTTTTSMAATTNLLKEAMQSSAGVLSAKALTSTTAEQRARFVAQMEGLRGARKSNEIIREFWIACRGNGFAYIT